MKDLKLVYKAISKDAAESELDRLEEKWGIMYPIVIQSWRNKWENLSYYFEYQKLLEKLFIQPILLNLCIDSLEN